VSSLCERVQYDNPKPFQLTDMCYVTSDFVESLCESYLKRKASNRTYDVAEYYFTK